jgi:aspartyl-tRNA(Asn)/glutamyl-tRNA(Gln) amidotransferase subunit A
MATDPSPCPGVAEAAAAIAAGSLSPVALLEQCLARIASRDGALHAFHHLDVEGARSAARDSSADIAAGRRRGPLHGLPFGVKDNYDATGLPCAAGSRLRAGYVPDRDAALVAALRGEGAVLAGKLATWEYGTGNGGEYFDQPVPPARNPWDRERFTGGSSTGCGVAVAEGMLPFALGSDTTGSVRLPAAATGTVGIIPTPGTLSLDGILPNCWSLDVPGAFAWTAPDVALVLEALMPGRPALHAATQAEARGLSVAVVRRPGDGLPDADAPLAEGFEAGLRVLSRLGVRLTEVALPVTTADCLAAARLIGPAESAAIHEQELRERPEQMGRALRDKLLAGSLVRAVDYLAAQRLRRVVADGMAALMARFDVLVTYGTLHLPPRLGVEPESTAFTLETMLTPFNLAGLPALVQCTGFSAEGLPLHWQMAARRGGEATLLRLAAAYEAATPWRSRRPA